MFMYFENETGTGGQKAGASSGMLSRNPVKTLSGKSLGRHAAESQCSKWGEMRLGRQQAPRGAGDHMKDLGFSYKW